MPDLIHEMRTIIDNSSSKLPSIKGVILLTKHSIAIAKRKENFLTIHSLEEITEIGIWEEKASNIEKEISDMEAALKSCKERLQSKAISVFQLRTTKESLEKVLGKQRELLKERRKIEEILEKGKPQKVKIFSN